MPKRKITLCLTKDPAISATRVSVGQSKLVYIMVADKRFKYPKGKSRIAYIGTTGQGLKRICESVAAKAEEILGLHGVKSFQVRIVTCSPRQAVKTWLKMERAMILEFREKYGEVPRCNVVGKSMIETDEFSYFARDGVRLKLEELA